MKNLLKAAILVLLALLNSNCANNIKIPNKVQVETTGVTTIRHEIVITAQLQNVFDDECLTEFPDATEEQLKLCRDKKSKAYIDQILNFINQNSEVAK